MKTKFVFLATFLLTTVAFSQKKWTLKECVDYALKNNITIKQNKLNLAASEVSVKSAKGDFLPSLSASTGGSLNFGSSFDPVTKNRVGTSNFGGSFGISTGITVFNGYRTLNSYKQSLLGVERSKLDLEKVVNDVSLNVVNAYLRILNAKENYEVAKVQAEISKKQIESAKVRYEAGAIAKGVLLNTQSTAANDLQNVIEQENNVNLSLLNLAQLINIPSEGFDVQPISIQEPSMNLLYSSANDVYVKALNNRPEIEKAELDIQNADLDIKIAKSAYVPSISASGNIGTNYGFNLDLPAGTSNTNFFKQLNNNLGYGLGFSVSIPIFNGFKTDASVTRSEINKKIVETNLFNEKLRLKQTIEQAYLDSKSAAKTYEAAKISLEAQKEAFKNAQESYNYGTMTQFDFDQVRNRLVNAESSLIRAKYNYVFKTKVLQFYYGELKLD